MNSGSQLLRFACVGALITALHVIVTITLVDRNHAGPIVANVVAFSIATLTGWALNTRWSFSRVASIHTLFRYVVVTILGLLVTVLTNAYCAIQGIPYKIALLIVVSVVPAMSFSLHQCWTYRSNGKGI